MNMTLKFYFFRESIPSKVVWSVLETLGVEYEEIIVDVFGKQENKTADFLAMNPSGKVPFVLDGDFGLSESRAIICYLCTKHEASSKKQKLYPSDLQERARVDEALNQDYQFQLDVVDYLNLAGVLYRNEVGPDENKWYKVIDVLERCETRLTRYKYMASDHITVADFSVLSTIGGFSCFIPDNVLKNYPKLMCWKAEMESLPAYRTCYGVFPPQFKAFYDKTVAERKAKMPDDSQKV